MPIRPSRFSGGEFAKGGSVVGVTPLPVGGGVGGWWGRSPLIARSRCVDRSRIAARPSRKFTETPTLPRRPPTDYRPKSSRYKIELGKATTLIADAVISRAETVHSATSNAIHVNGLINSLLGASKAQLLHRGRGRVRLFFSTSPDPRNSARRGWAGAHLKPNAPPHFSGRRPMGFLAAGHPA